MAIPVAVEMMVRSFNTFFNSVIFPPTRTRLKRVHPYYFFKYAACQNKADQGTPRNESYLSACRSDEARSDAGMRSYHTPRQASGQIIIVMASRRTTSSCVAFTLISPCKYFCEGFRSPQNMSQRFSLIVVTMMSGVPSAPVLNETISPFMTFIVNQSPVSSALKCSSFVQSRCIRRSLLFSLQLTW